MKNVFLILATIFLTFSVRAQCPVENAQQVTQSTAQESVQPITIWQQKLR